LLQLAHCNLRSNLDYVRSEDGKNFNASKRSSTEGKGEEEEEKEGESINRKKKVGYSSVGFRIWKEHISVSSTLIIAPALSNSPQ